MADNELIIRINGSAKNFLDEVDKVKKQTESLEKTLTATAKASAAAFAVFSGSIAALTKEFADYETALVGVGKTTNIEGKRLEKFGKQFQKLSSQIPISTNELLGIAQAAGQLGVTGEDNLLKFTETVAKLGVATDLAGEEAATALTRILNVTGEGISTIDTFGSVIVALGNNFAATESEIVRVTTEVSRSTAVFGVGSASAAALATAMRSVGVQAQLGGSAVGRAFRAIDENIRKGGNSLENLSRITGIAADQLQKRFAEDSIGVFQQFVEGLGDIAEAGGSTSAALESFGLKGDEINKVLPVLAKNSELLGRALSTANKETENATALNNEAAKAFATLNSDFQRAKNAVTNAATAIGSQLAPAVSGLLKSVTDLAKSISELDQETLGAIASFLKWGAIITGAIASVSTFLLGLLKVRSLLAGLRVAFTVGRVAAIGFTGALTGGLSLVIGFLPEIISGVKKLLGLIGKDEEPKSIDNINSKLDELKKKQEDLEKTASTNQLGQKNRSQERLEQVNEEIKKLEELRQQQIKNSKDFGTGSLLVRPETDGTDPLAGIDTDLGFTSTVQAPLAPPEAENNEVDAVKRKEEQKQAIIDEATQKRIDTLSAENEKLAQLQEARLEGANQTELDFLQRKIEIDQEFAEAEKIKNESERQIALDNLTLKHAAELQRINDFENKKDELAAAKREERAILDEELRELDKEQRDLFNEEDLQALQSRIDSQSEAERKYAEEKLNKQIAERNRFKQDEIKHGTAIAEVKAFFRKEEVQGFKNASAQLAQLSNSRNSTLKGIGKAAARVNAAIKTAEGAISAYTALSGIPIVGPALGAAAAAALVAYGVEQQQKISAAQRGGFVPSAQGGARDRVPALLEPGELVVPQAIAPDFIQAAGRPEVDAETGTTPSVGVTITLADNAFEIIEARRDEEIALGIREAN